jgi:hypothetical protein
MDPILVNAAVAAAGLVSGASLSALLIRHRRPHSTDITDHRDEPNLDSLFEDVASAWARARGRPELAPLLTSKLRTMRTIRQRRARPANHGWRKPW